MLQSFDHFDRFNRNFFEQFILGRLHNQFCFTLGGVELLDDSEPEAAVVVGGVESVPGTLISTLYAEGIGNVFSKLILQYKQLDRSL